MKLNKRSINLNFTKKYLMNKIKLNKNYKIILLAFKIP